MTYKRVFCEGLDDPDDYLSVPDEPEKPTALVKHDGNKPKWLELINSMVQSGELDIDPEYRNLIFSLLGKETNAVLKFGEAKYGKNNWMNGSAEDINRYCEAITRHAYQMRYEGLLDKESQIHHVGHIVSSCLFIMYLSLKHTSYVQYGVPAF